MSSFPEVNIQNLGRQRLFFILDLGQYNPDAMSFPEPHLAIHLTCQWHSFPRKNRHHQSSQSRRDLWIQGSHQSHLTSGGISTYLLGQTVLGMSWSPALRRRWCSVCFPPLAFGKEPIWVDEICGQHLQLHVGFPIHFLLVRLLRENCQSRSDHAVPRIRAGVRLGCFKPPALLQGARPGWEGSWDSMVMGGQERAPGGLPGGAVCAGHSLRQRQTHRRGEGAEAFPPAQVWLGVTLEQPQPPGRAGKPCYCSPVTKRDRETDVPQPGLFGMQIAP